MSKRYGESMADWERNQDERDWKQRCEIAIKNCDRDQIQLLIEEGVDNAYDADTILKLEEL